MNPHSIFSSVALPATLLDCLHHKSRRFRGESIAKADLSLLISSRDLTKEHTCKVQALLNVWYWPQLGG